jgi:hypothetical protein
MHQMGMCHAHEFEAVQPLSSLCIWTHACGETVASVLYIAQTSKGDVKRADVVHTGFWWNCKMVACSGYCSMQVGLSK